MHDRLFLSVVLPFTRVVVVTAMGLYGAGPAAAGESFPFVEVSGSLVPCPALETDSLGHAAFGAEAVWILPIAQGVVPALALLPARAAFMVCTLVESALEESGFAADKAGSMSRRDALWLQAGYGAGRSPTTDGPGLDFPKWSATDPALFRFLPGQTEQTRTAPSLFSFQIGP